jgi:hypothetical protein
MPKFEGTNESINVIPPEIVMFDATTADSGQGRNRSMMDNGSSSVPSLGKSSSQPKIPTQISKIDKSINRNSRRLLKGWAKLNPVTRFQLIDVRKPL